MGRGRKKDINTFGLETASQDSPDTIFPVTFWTTRCINIHS
jgi:hypothetical protein